MMNRLKKAAFISLNLSLLFATGCSQKEQEKRENLSEADQALAVSIDQKKTFSRYQLQDVGKKEAEAALTEKLQLPLPDFAKEIETLTFKHLEANEALTVDSTFYSISSQDREAAYSVSAVMKNEEGLYPIYSTSQIDYAYNSSKEVAYMDMYKVEVVNSEANGEYNGGDLESYVLALGKAAEITEEDIAGEVELLVAKTKEELVNKYIVLYDTFDKAEKERTIGKRLRIAYGETGVPVKIQLYVKDYYNQ